MSSHFSQNWRASVVAYAPLILWIGVIFFLSSDQGSMSQTSRFIRPLLHFMFPAASEETIEFYHACIRKSAHVTEYAILALIAFRTFGTPSRRPKMRYIMSAALALIIASTDEFNQSFEPSRTSSPYDILLDMAGGLIGLSAIWLFCRFRHPVQSLSI